MLALTWEADAISQLEGLLDFIGNRNESAAERIARPINTAFDRARSFPAIDHPAALPARAR